MIRAIIVEDQKHCVRRLETLIEENAPNVDIVGVFDNVDDAVKGTEKLKPELVFLDIEIQDKTGFEYLEALEHPDFNLIFTTGHPQFAKKAFKYSALDFLEKPIDKDDFKDSIDRYNERITRTFNSLRIQTLLDNKIKKGQEKEIYFEYSGKFDKIIVKNISYIKKEDTNIILHLIDETSITLNKSLAFYEDLLKDFYFFRIHHNTIVNLKHASSYEKFGSQIRLTLNNNKEFIVSSRRKKAFIEALKNFSL
jgi:two-component system LytT family response regulator